MIKKFMKPLAVALIVTLVISFAIPWVSGICGSADSSLVLAYEGIGKGLDPKGKVLDIGQLKSDEVLKKAIKNAGLSKELTTDELRSRIAVSPVVQEGALAQLLTITVVEGKREAVVEKASNIGEWTVKVKDTKIPNPMETIKLTNALTKAYKEYLKNQYLGATEKVESYKEKDLDGMDYSEKAQLLGQEADFLVRYAVAFGTDSKFVSEKTGDTFRDMQAATELLRDSEVKNIKDIINYYMITTDADQRQVYEQVKLRRAETNLTKASGREFAVSSMLNMYDNNTNYVSTMNNGGIPAGKSVDNLFYGSLTKDLLDRKSERIDSTYKQVEIRNNLQTIVDSDLTADETAALTKDMNEAIKKTYKSMEGLKGEIQALGKEYYEKEIGSRISATKAGYRPYVGVSPIAVFMIVFIGMIVWRTCEVKALIKKGIVSLKGLRPRDSK